MRTVRFLCTCNPMYRVAHGTARHPDTRDTAPSRLRCTREAGCGGLGFYDVHLPDNLHRFERLSEADAKALNRLAPSWARINAHKVPRIPGRK